MKMRIAVLAGLLTATAVSGAVMSESSQRQVSSTEHEVSAGTSNAELLALWKATASNDGRGSRARPQ